MPSKSLWDRLLDLILPKEDITVSKLEGWVKNLDGNFEQNRLHGVSFETSIDNQLGFTGNKNDFTIFSPWGTWANEGGKHYPTPLQQGLIDAFHQAELAQKADYVSLNCPFVDFASLVPGTEFFTEEAGDGQSVAQRIADWLNAHDHKTTSPCIRFLVGDNGSKGRDLSFHDEPFTNMFWPQAHGKRTPLVTHPKARIYVGYYNPDFRPR